MNNRVYLMGIGGIGMANFAALLKEKGLIVSGSDANVYEPAASFLRQAEIDVLTPYASQNIPLDGTPIVVGNALSRGHVEVEAALNAGVPLYSFPEYLNRFVLTGRHPIVVAGTHGKSTTTACLAHLLHSTNQDPGFLVGAMPLNFSAGAALGKGQPFVLEGDEYDSAFFDKRSKFLHYFPRTLLLGTVEYDHADIFSSVDEMLLSFRRLINLLPQNGRLIYCSDCEATSKLAGSARCQTISVGTTKSSAWQLRPSDSSHLEFLDSSGTMHRISFASPGIHNRMNALMALAAAMSYHDNLSNYLSALESFRGIKRRLEKIWDANGLVVYDDFAHHPTAIASALQAIRESHPHHHVVAVCEPRSNTMVRKIFQSELASAFTDADEIVFGAIHRADRIPQEDRLDLEQVLESLRLSGKSCVQLKNNEIPQHLFTEANHPKVVVVFMSNGGFDGVQQDFIQLILQS